MESSREHFVRFQGEILGVWECNYGSGFGKEWMSTSVWIDEGVNDRGRMKMEEKPECAKMACLDKNGITTTQ